MTTSEALVGVLREALWLAALVAAPPLGAALAAGLVAGLVQSATRVEERALGTVARLAAALAALALAGPWIGDAMVRFTTALLAALPAIGRS